MQHVHNLIRKEKLRSFRIGEKLLRIPAEEVARWEALQQTTSSESSTDGELSPREKGRTIEDSRLRLRDGLTQKEGAAELASLSGMARCASPQCHSSSSKKHPRIEVQPARAVGPCVQIAAGSGDVVMPKRRLNLWERGPAINCMGAMGMPQPVG